MDDEQKKTLQVPAVFANRFHITRTLDSARLAFGETIDSELVYRVAVRMIDADMLALRDLLNQLYPPGQKQN